MRKRSSDFVAMVLAMIAVTCALPPGGDGQEAVVRDSSGVRIVENAPPVESVPLWSVADTPELVIGTQAGDASFTLYQVNDARFLSDGRILVRSGLELLWFDSSGRFLSRGGGRGEGPSESLALIWVAVLEGDSVIALSRRPPSLKLFGPDGGFVRTVAMPPVHGVLMRRLGTAGWAGIAFGGESPPASAGIFRERWHLVRYTPDLGPADTLLSLDGRMLYGDRSGSVNVPGSPSAYFAARGSVIVAGQSDTYELKVFSAGGELRHIIRNSIPNPSESQLLEPVRDRPAPREAGASRQTPRPPTLEAAPAYDGIFVASDGAVWVRRLAGPDAETVRANTLWGSTPSSGRGPVWVAEGLQGQEWHVYDQEGRFRARAELPSRFRPTEITASRIVGVWKDELGVESIRVFRLIRR